jgi:hypothetical protein
MGWVEKKEQELYPCSRWMAESHLVAVFMKELVLWVSSSKHAGSEKRRVSQKDLGYR